MANALFDAAREAFLEGDLDWGSHTFKVYGIDEGTDTPSVSADDFADDIDSGAKVFTSGALTTSTPLGNGVADADDITVASVSGASVESLIVWRDTSTQSTSNLVLYIDTASAGLPFTPNGGSVQIVWASSGNRIFKL